MFSKVFRLLLFILVAVLWHHFYSDQPGGPSERRPPLVMPKEAPFEERAPTPRRPLPGPSPLDPRTQVDLEGCADSCTGTAFAVGVDGEGDGVWLTARHVVEGCRELGLVTEGRRVMAVKNAVVDDRADLSLLETDRQSEPLPFSPDRLEIGQPGYAYGFPQGSPGAVAGELLGRLSFRVTGRARFTAPAVAWAELARVPDALPALGGISGGPMIDESGRVIGVAIAASERRGRVITAAPVSVADFLQTNGVRPLSAARADPVIQPSRFPAYGEPLLQELRIAQVLCSARDGRLFRGGRVFFD